MSAEQLPCYADTGQPFRPGRDKAWMILDKVYEVAGGSCCGGEWGYYCDGLSPDSFIVTPAYSTREAATKAKGD